MFYNPGLKPTPHDPRDYSYHKTFGASALVLPEEYFAGRPKAKDQKLSQMCTAFASYVLGACEDGVDFCPEYSFAAGKTISKEPLDAPEDLRTPLQTAVQFGYLPVTPGLPSLETQSPVYCADIANYPPLSAFSASKYKKKSYFRVDSDFDTIRQVLYNNAPGKRAIITGVLWMNEWTATQKGLVPDFAVSPAGLHCIPIIGFTDRFLDGTKFADGQPRLVVQNSYVGYGEESLFYFDKDTFNKNFTEPMYMLVETGSDVAPSKIGNWFSILLFNIFRRLI